MDQPDRRARDHGATLRRQNALAVVIMAAVLCPAGATDAFAQTWQRLVEEVVRGLNADASRQRPQSPESTVPLGAQPAQAAPAARSCSRTAGPEKAQELARQCRQVSEATRPPCHADNPCSMMVDEIRRSCALKRSSGVRIPAICNQTFGAGVARPAGIDAASVREIQRQLDALGYEPGAVDGLLGSETRRALQRFQRVNHLPATGEPTAATISALRNAYRNLRGGGETTPAGSTPSHRNPAAPVSPASPSASASMSVYRMNDGGQTGELKLIPQADGSVSLEIDLKARGCLGSISARGNRQGSGIVAQAGLPYVPGSSPCTLKMDDRNDAMIVEEGDCTSFHGMSCTFSGTYRLAGSPQDK